LKLNIVKSSEDLWSINVHKNGDVDNHTCWMECNISDYNPWSGPIATLTTATDAANTNKNAKTINTMSEQEIYFYLHLGIWMKLSKSKSAQWSHTNLLDTSSTPIHAPKYPQMLPTFPAAQESCF
jgi:hypothetical protein